MYNIFKGGIMKKLFDFIINSVIFRWQRFCRCRANYQKNKQTACTKSTKNTNANAPRVKSSSNINKTAPQNNKLVNSVKMCKPYSETMTFGMSGVDFDFNVKLTAGLVTNVF